MRYDGPVFPEILRCPGGGCPLRERCLRFRAIAYGRHDAFGSPPWSEAEQACANFEDLARHEPTDAQIEVRAYHLWEREGRPTGSADAHYHAARAQLWETFHAALRPVPAA